MPRNLSQDFLSSIVGHWDFDGDLTDDSGNSFTLTHSGTERFSTIDDLQAVWLDLGDTLTRANEALLEITGVLTIHMMVHMGTNPGGSLATLLEFGDRGSGASTDNVLYAIDFQSGTLRYFAEEGSGTDINHNFAMGLPLRSWHLITLVRDAGGEVTLYIDGEVAGTASSSLNPPADGADSTLTIGSTNFRGYLGGIMIGGVEATADEVYLQYRHVFEIGVQFRNLNEDLLSDVRAHWDFEDTITDRVGGLTLSLQSGNQRERYMTVNGLRCFAGIRSSGSSSGYLAQSAHTATLSITGELTVHTLYYQQQEEMGGSTVGDIFAYAAAGGGGESQETNWLYSLRMRPTRDVLYFAEEGAGTNTEHQFQVQAPVWGMHLLTLTRDASGDVVFYIDGKASGLASSGINPPTTGGVQVQILALGVLLNNFIMGGLLIAAYESSAEEVEAMWRWVTRGGPDQRTQVGGSCPVYIMRALHSSLGVVTWLSDGKPDLTGSSSRYVPSDLSNIRVVRETVR